MIRLTAEPLDVGAASMAVSDAAAGGIAIFCGTTRSEISPDGRRLAALDYEAYPEMAVRQLESLETTASAKWSIIRAIIWHRTGPRRSR